MKLTDTASQVGERLSDAKELAKDLGRTAGGQLEEARQWMSEEVQGAAASVRTAGRHGSEAIDGLASNTADKLNSTAEYVRSHDAGGMLAGLRQLIRRHPACLFVTAAAIGFLAGASLQTNARRQH